MRKDLIALNKLKKYMEISKEIDAQTKALETKVGSAKLTAIDGFKPYINPKRNIGYLLSFYNTFAATKESTEREKTKLKGIFGESKDRDRYSPRELKMLREKDALTSLQALIGAQETLEQYDKIKVVVEELGSLSKFIIKILDAVAESFFSSLKKIPEQDPELREFAAFLLSNTDKRDFMSKYTTIIYSRLGFDDIGMNTKLLLEKTSNLTRFFSDIIEMNDSILGPQNSKITNVGLLKMLIIGLRRVVADHLIRAEKEEKIESVPFLISLNARLAHSGDTRVRIIEELFVFKDDINKIVCNCISGYFESLNMLMNPNECSDIEPLCLKLLNVLDAFYDHRNVAEVFATTYGSSFNVKTAKDIFVEFSSRTIEKILFLAESLKGIAKSVYIINNVYALQSYIEDVDGVPTDRIIDKNVENILSVWEKEIARRNEGDITEFLDRNIENQSKYLLPQKIRDELTDTIAGLIDKMLEGKRYTGDVEKLHTNIGRLYFAE